jgi:5-enolpyruvylshikimate-3-phosphate synthase
MAAKGETTVDTAESVKITYPSFYADMETLGARLKKIE